MNCWLKLEEKGLRGGKGIVRGAHIELIYWAAKYLGWQRNEIEGTRWGTRWEIVSGQVGEEVG